MSNGYATQTTQYEPPRRSIAGAVVLILLGVVFLLGNLHVIPWSRLGFYFARYWPAVLILWGAIKLIEHFVAQRQGRQAARIGAGGVILMILLVVAGLIASAAQRVRWNELNDEWNIQTGVLEDMFGQEYAFQQQLQQDFPAGTTLRVSSDRGSVTVHTWDQNRIQVNVTKRLRAESREDAGRADNATRAQINVAGTECVVNANTHGAGDRQVQSDLDITIPANATVDIATRRGDVTIRNRNGNVQVSNSGGNVNLDDIKGDAVLKVRRGEIRAAKVTGEVFIDGEVSNVSINDTGSVRLSGGVTDRIALARIQRSVEYQSSRTTLKFARLDGDLTLQGGDLNGNSIVGPLRLMTRSKDIHLNDVAGPLEVENTNGEVDVHVSKLPLGGIQIRNRKGDIRLVLPARAAFQIEARTRRGDINSDYSLDQRNERREGVASGTVGGGGPRVEIDNEYGDVSIKKAG